MCGTFAILSPDLFTYVYSGIPPGRERTWIYSERQEGVVGGRGDVPSKSTEDGVLGGLVRGKEGSEDAVLVSWTGGVASEGRLCSIFKILYDLFFDDPLCPVVVRVKGHVNDRRLEQFSLSSSSLSFLSFFLRTYRERVYPYPVGGVCQTIFPFLLSRLIAPRSRDRFRLLRNARIGSPVIRLTAPFYNIIAFY